jgi:replicative DNA helicase
VRENTPPHSLEAEENVLGAILSAEKVPAPVLDQLSPKHFYRNHYAAIYKACLELHNQAKPTSAIAVADQMRKNGSINPATEGVLATLLALTPTISNAGHHAQIIRDNNDRRELIVAALKIGNLAQEGQGEVEDIRAEAERLLYDASDGVITRSALPINAELDELVEEIRTAYSTGQPITGLTTGFGDIDGILHGLWPSQLVLLAARTGQGKSTLAQNIAENIADAGSPVLFFTLEMSRRELQLRSIARAGRIDGDRLSTGQVTKEEAGRLKDALEIVRGRTNLLIHDEGITTTATLASLARRHNEQHPLGLVVVDYIGLLQGEGENQTQRIASISRNLKLLAQNLHVPILALSQMNRKQDDRTDKEPRLSDLRDSGALEQDADVVLFLHREADHDPGVEDTGSIKVIVAKNRKGKMGTVELAWNQASSRFLTQKGKT